MRFQLLTAALLSLTLLTSALAQDAGVSSIVSEIDSIKSELYALSIESNNAVAASSLGSVLASFIVSVSTNSDWPAASSILRSQAAAYSAKLSTRHSLTTTDASATKTTAASSLLGSLNTVSSPSSATSAGLAPMVTAGIIWHDSHGCSRCCCSFVKGICNRVTMDILGLGRKPLDRTLSSLFGRPVDTHRSIYLALLDSLFFGLVLPCLI